MSYITHRNYTEPQETVANAKGKKQCNWTASCLSLTTALGGDKERRLKKTMKRPGCVEY